jgi:hypothetical protein
VAANAAMTNIADRQEANFKTDATHWWAHTSGTDFVLLVTDVAVVKAYGEQYSKFVPDSENKAWFACKEPRILELYTLRDLASVFALFFYVFQPFDVRMHEFSGHNGLNLHFAHMAFHQEAGANLRCSHNNDKAAMLTTAAWPVTVELWNPYPAGHKWQADFLVTGTCHYCGMLFTLTEFG